MSEVFVGKEMEVFKHLFDKIYIFPLEVNGKVRGYDKAKITVNNSLGQKSNVPRMTKFRILLKNLHLVLYIITTELIHSKNSIYIIRNLKYLLHRLTKVLLYVNDIKDPINQFPNNSRFYSIWLNEGALIFSILKFRNVITNYHVRLHGYDLFDYRQKGGYIPFRYFMFKFADKISVQTKEAYEYLINKKLFPEKIAIHYQGVFDHGLGPFIVRANGPLTLVSCSNLFKLKRVDKIIEALSISNVEVRWIHFGDGPEKENLNQLVKNKGQALNNVQIIWKGRVPNEKLIEFYQSNQIDLFIHLSETEGGVPVAIQEAMSFGIPVIATNIGGIPEIVNSKTGYLLQNDFTDQTIADFIDGFKNSPYNTEELRNNVRKFWKENFDAVTNYTILARDFLLSD